MFCQFGQLLRFYTSFELLGDLELFERSNPYTTIQAASDSLCLALSLANTHQLLHQDPVFLRYICEVLCAKLYVSSSNNALSIFYPLENRLASYILVMGVRKPKGGGTRLCLEENLAELAEQLGTSYRHLQRTLRALSDAHILRKVRRQYEVLDEDRLNCLAADHYLVSDPPHLA